jgi:hypothetical protein
VPFPLRRRTPAPDLELTHEHEAIAAPRRGRIDWQTFHRAAWPEAALREAAADWRERARTEYCSLAIFTELASCVQRLGAPLDWAGAFARMIGDEVRHAELCARMAEVLGGAEPAAIDPEDLRLPVARSGLRAHVRQTVVAVFCIGETLSGRMFRRCLRAATVPLARDVVRAIVDDETFHGRFGWEAAALLMRGDQDDAFEVERAALARALPELFAHYRHACSADGGEAWARGEPAADPTPNFGTLTRAGYARAFYDGMREDVVPGLVAIGLPEAADAWAAVAG